MAKITIAGAGKVGITAVQLAAYKELGDITVWNRTAKTAKGMVLDIVESAPIEEFDVEVKATSNFEDTADSDVIAITAGAPRKEGQSRDDLLFTNADIVKNIVPQLSKYSKDAVIIVVTNPMDSMVYLTYKLSKFSKNKVVGMAGILDTARFRSFIAEKLNVAVEDVSALVLGSHGDFMVPLTSQALVGDVPLEKLLSKKEIDQIIERTRNAGSEIISLTGNSSFYAPAASLVQMIESVIKDKKRVLPCAVYLDGEYGLSDVFMGVPVKLGKNGVEDIIELELADYDLNLLKKSAAKVKESLNLLKSKGYF